MVFLDILTGVFFLVLGIVVLRLAMIHQAPDGRISRFFGVYKLVSPPLGFVTAAIMIIFGLFVMVQSIRAALGHI